MYGDGDNTKKEILLTSTLVDRFGYGDEDNTKKEIVVIERINENGCRFWHDCATCPHAEMVKRTRKVNATIFAITAIIVIGFIIRLCME